MKIMSIMLGVLVAGCGMGGPSITDITCQAGHGTCFVAHCDARSPEKCKSYFHKQCPNGFDDQSYGIETPGHHDRLVTCH
jgi:hypothetical protein